MFHCLLICHFYRMVYVYVALMSVLTRDKFLNFIVETIKKYLIFTMVFQIPFQDPFRKVDPCNFVYVCMSKYNLINIFTIYILLNVITGTRNIHNANDYICIYYIHSALSIINIHR